MKNPPIAFRVSLLVLIVSISFWMLHFTDDQRDSIAENFAGSLYGGILVFSVPMAALVALLTWGRGGLGRILLRAIIITTVLMSVPLYGALQQHRPLAEEAFALTTSREANIGLMFAVLIGGSFYVIGRYLLGLRRQRAVTVATISPSSPTPTP